MILDDDDDELMEELMNDDEDDEFLHGMYQFAVHIDKYMNRAQYRTPRVSVCSGCMISLTTLSLVTTCLE